MKIDVMIDVKEMVMDDVDAKRSVVETDLKNDARTVAMSDGTDETTDESALNIEKNDVKVTVKLLAKNGVKVTVKLLVKVTAKLFELLEMIAKNDVKDTVKLLVKNDVTVTVKLLVKVTAKLLEMIAMTNGKTVEMPAGRRDALAAATFAAKALERVPQDLVSNRHRHPLHGGHTKMPVPEDEEINARKTDLQLIVDMDADAAVQ